MPGDPGHDLFMFGGEATRQMMAEEEPALNLSALRYDGHREVTGNGQVPRRHALVRDIMPIAGILLDIVGPHDPLPHEGGREDRRVARHREACKRFPRNAGEAVEHVALTILVDQIIEEGAKFRAGEFDGGISDGLDDMVEVRLGRDCCADAVDDFERCLQRNIADGRADQTGQLAKQVDRKIIRPVLSRPICADRHRLRSGFDRGHHHAAHEGGFVKMMRDTDVSEDVGDDGRFPMLHHPA